MAILLTGTTIGGHSAIHAGNLATHGIVTTSNIGSYALTSIPSHNHDDRYYTESESDTRFVNVGGDTITGNLIISGATLGIVSTTSGSDPFYVDGVNGRLFSVTDDLSDSLFSVNTIAGLPVIEAFADNTVNIGPFTNPVTINNAGLLFIGGLQAATQSYVDTSITNLIGGAPGALDTLNELAAAINDDASFASSVTTSLATKAPLASPALTGTPTAPTASTATNNTQIATTAFVKAQGYSTTTGTVTSVSGTGSVNGITLSGTVTSSGSLTLGGTLVLTSAQVTTALGYTPVTSARTLTINGTTLDLSANRTFTISTITGNAGTATTLATARTLTIGNTGKTFNGSANVSWSLAEIGAQPAGSYLTSITAAQVHGAIYTTGGDANGYTTFGIYRNYAVNGPVASHNTIFNVMQADGNYGFQLGANTTASADGLYFRSKDATIGTWKQVASREWVTAQGYITNTGTVTSVSGTGSYGGLTLSGTVTSSGSLTLGGTPTGTWPISISGNAATATKLQTARNIALGGDVSGSANFDGSANITITATVADDSHNHIISNVDGLQAALDGKQPVGSYLTTSGKAADSELIDGIDSSRIVYGDGANGRSISRTSASANTSDSSNASGFYFGNSVAGLPTTDWWNWLTVRANSWSGSDGYQFQLAGSFWSDDYRIRRMTSGTNHAWVSIIHSGTIGSQSVNYAATAGNADTLDGFHASVAGAANSIPTRNANGYLIPENWIQLNGTYGLYSPTNGAHFYPNNGSYGSWRIEGSKNDYRGLQFSSGTNGDVSLMIHVNSNIIGFHNASYDWQFYWSAGTLYCFKNNYGGGTQATVLDSSNYSTWAQPIASAINTSNIGSQSVSFATTAGALSSMNISQFTNNSGYIVEGGTTFSGQYPMLVRTSASTAYSHPGINFRGSDSALLVTGVVYASGGNSSNWNTAYGWGNHASAGYLTSYTETDTLASVTGRGNTANSRIIINSTGTAGVPTLSVNTSTSSTFVHSQENLAANLTAGQHNIIVVGKTGNTKNSGYIGYYWAGAASDSNFVTIGHWGANDLFRVYADGTATVGTNTVWHAGNLTNLNQLTNGPGYITSSALSGYATQSYVNTAVSNLVDSAPGTLDTLNELAAALGDDPNFATTVTNSIATKAPLASPALTGTPTATTASTATNSTQIATTAFVKNQGYITGVTNISGYSGTLQREDNRTISPSELASERLKFGFTSWANNNTAPYADFLHMRSYSDTSGGNDNLVMFLKNGIGMRIYQQAFGSATAYSTFKDVAFTDSSITGNAGSATVLQTARTLTIGNTGKTFNGGANVSWSLAEIGAQPAGSYAAASHTHTIANVTGLQAALDGKQASGSYLTTSGKAADSNLLDGIDSSGFQRQIDQSIVNIVSPNASSGTWSTSDTDDWGTPRIGSIAARYNDGTGYLQFNVPSGMDSAYVSHLTWFTGGYLDCYGVQADGGLVFLRRINTRQSIENTNEGSNGGNPNQHDGSTISLVGTGLSSFSAVRLQNRVGRFHLTGMSFTSAKLQGTEGTGMVHPGQLSVSGSGSGLDADLLDGNHASAFAAASHTHTPSQVGLGNVSNAAQVTTTNNSSLNSDSRNTRGVTRLYRRDSNSDYSVQTHWTGTYWRLMGYNGDSYHADTHVGYAEDAGLLNRHGLLTSQDWNGYFFNAKMLVSSVSGHSGPNRPTDTYEYGSVLSYGASGEDAFQMYFPENGANSIANSRKLHYRSGWNGNWSSWKTVVDMVDDTCTLFYGTSAKLKIQGSTGYGSPSNASIDLLGDADNNQTRGYRFISDASDWNGQELRIERYSDTFGYQLVGRIPQNTSNLEWQGTIVQGLSDERVKTNVSNMRDGIDKINQIRPVTFDWVPTENVSDRDDSDFGFIAQELEEVLPEVVHTRGDGYKTVMYEKVVPVLVQAMKEQQAMIEKLMARIEILENK